jgi:hypothetical protein
MGIGCLLVLVFAAAGDHSKILYTKIAIMGYDDQRELAMKGDLSQAAASLKQVVDYWYTKAPREGHMADILKAFRASVIREIISRMRLLSGEDLGNDPQLWIDKYYRKDAMPEATSAGTNHALPIRVER